MSSTQKKEIINIGIEEKIVYNPIPNRVATFKSGIDKQIHSWFRLTPSFGPDLVEIMLEKLHYSDDDIVLDPFSGASTTLIQCKLKNIQSIGFEINPLLFFVGKTSLNWDLDYDTLIDLLKTLEISYINQSRKLHDKDVINCGLEIPKIHNVFRWWRKDVLKELLILKSCIKTLNTTNDYRDFFLLTLAGVLVPDLTNVSLGRLQLYFIDRDEDSIDVYEVFKNHVESMVSDIKTINNEYKENAIRSDLYLADATNIDSLGLSANTVDLVITSPPYPNRYSYVWNTRPHLYFLDIFDNAKQASNLDKETIGGTWGVATSHIATGIVNPEYSIIEEVVKPITDKIRLQDNLMANYVMKYFNLLAKQIVELEKIATKNIKVAYVVGNSEIKGVYVETDVLLGKIFEGLDLGYSVNEITRFRKRNSGIDLYESIVYANKK